MNIQTLSQKFGVNVETEESGFPTFVQRVKGKRVLVLTDAKTHPMSQKIVSLIQKAGEAVEFSYPEEEPIADEKTVNAALAAATDCDYLLAVGAGTLNDICKRAGYLLHKPCGVFATAPSMDGFTSGVTPLIEGGFKITREAQVVSDVLLDYSILAAAPRMMIGAGVGDILAKYCCLTDWRISSYLTGEEYNEAAANLMYETVEACAESVPALTRGEEGGVQKLMEALLISGYAMVVAGNSRPASGAEHHISHFLEMDFLKRGEKIPLHGVKVGLGTLVSLYLYHTLPSRPAFDGCEKVYAEAQKLPSVEWAENILASLGCPTKFSELRIPRETIRRMFFEAYKIRDRFTILTLYCQKGFMADTAEELLARFY